MAALTPSPPPSLSMGDAAALGRPNEVPVSKRDKKRTQLLEKLQEVIKGFTKNKDGEYRTQLQALQVDIALILSTNPLDGKKILDAHTQELITMIMGYRGGDAEELREQFKNMDTFQFAGKIFDEFRLEVEAAEEERDANLTVLREKYENGYKALRESNIFHLKLAEDEHKALSSTLRDRLINSIQSRKNRLMRDKESSEIGEANALHLHPNQYTITNPSSPGGMHSKRATRHRREIEDTLPGYSDNKRKRKAGEDAGSPAPHRRLIDQNGNNSQIWSPAEIIRSSSNSTAPLYSVEKLFTERELQMNYNTAAVAAQQFIVRHKLNMDEEDADGEPDEEASSGHDDENGTSTPAGLASGAAAMERQVSHATRSTRGGAGNNNMAGGMEVLADMYDSDTFQRISSLLPKMPASSIIQGNMFKTWPKLAGTDSRNEPMALPLDEVARDARRIEKAKEMELIGGVATNLNDAGLNDKELLAAASGSWKWGEVSIKYSKKKDKDSVIEGGEPMARMDSNRSGTSRRR